MKNLQELRNIVVGVSEMLNRLHEADLQYAGPLRSLIVDDELLNILYRKLALAQVSFCIVTLIHENLILLWPIPCENCERQA
jgi:hypothetical protein